MMSDHLCDCSTKDGYRCRFRWSGWVEYGGRHIRVCGIHRKLVTRTRHEDAPDRTFDWSIERWVDSIETREVPFLTFLEQQRTTE